MTSIELNVNGVDRRVDATDDDLLLDVLRDAVGCTSAREGCGVGVCGACTVLVEPPGVEHRDAAAAPRSVSSCLARAVRYDGARITTSDGLAADDPVVAAFVAAGAMQCGYCIPGFVMMAHELLAENPHPTRGDVVAHLEGNICRCGAYPEIIEAILAAAGQRSRRGPT